MKNLKILSVVAMPFLGFSGTIAPATTNANTIVTTNTNVVANQSPQINDDLLPNVDGKPIGLLWKIAADLQASLTPEQKAKLFERMNEMQNQHQRQMRGGRGQRGGMMQHGGRGMQRGGMMQRGQGQGAMLGGMNDILTPEQKENLLEKYKDQMPGAQRREEAKQAMAQALNLSSRQQQDLENLHNTTREQLKALREQGKTANADKKALHEKAKQIHENAKTSRERILTDKQKEIVKIHQALVMKAKMNKRHGQMRQGQMRQGQMRGQMQRGMNRGGMNQRPMRGGMNRGGNRF